MNRWGSVLQTQWDWRAAGTFRVGGAGCGLILMTAAASYPHSPPLSLALQALAFIGLGLFMVWLEIGRPWRALHNFFHPQTSWMTREDISKYSLSAFFVIRLMCSIRAQIS